VKSELSAVPQSVKSEILLATDTPEHPSDLQRDNAEATAMLPLHHEEHDVRSVGGD
jgi:hypothetical protein